MNKYRAILEKTSEFSTKGQQVLRYEGNDLVQGDNVSEHIARCLRLITYLTPLLLKEFGDDYKFITDLYAMTLLHDDDEIIDGYDIVTYKKLHNSKDDLELEKFYKKTENLPENSYVRALFKQFRKKETVTANIAKIVDRLTGNQLVLEQNVSIKDKDYLRFCIRYVEDMLGISNTTDGLIKEQVKAFKNYSEE